MEVKSVAKWVVMDWVEWMGSMGSMDSMGRNGLLENPLR